MTLVVGIAPEARSRAVAHLAGILARSAGEDVVVCAVVPVQWLPSAARVDAEYQAYVLEAAREACEETLERLPGEVSATCEVVEARSVPAGLLQVADERGASAIVAGSSSGAFGQVSLGSVTDRLVHSSSVPVALAPRGWRCTAAARVTRVTAAYGGTEQDDDLVVAAAAVAARVGASLRFASFGVQPRPPRTAAAAREAEVALRQAWLQEVTDAARAAFDRIADLAAPPDIETVVGFGTSWDEALEEVEWYEGDVLVVGSSNSSPLARVFLGSRAFKIVRHAPVPVVIVPHVAAVEIVEEAERAA